MFSCFHLPSRSSRCFGLKFHILSTCLGWCASSGLLSWQGRHRQIAESLVYQAAGPSKDGWVWLSDGFANEAEHFLEERGPHLSMYSQSRHRFRHRPSRQRHLSFLACELPGWTAQSIWSGDLPSSPENTATPFARRILGHPLCGGMVCHGQNWPRLVWFCWGSCNVSGLHGGRPNPSGWLSASGRFRGLDSSGQKAREAAASHASQSHFCMIFPAHGSQSHPGSRQWHHTSAPWGVRWVELIFWKRQPIKATSGQFWRHSGRNAPQISAVSAHQLLLSNHRRSYFAFHRHGPISRWIDETAFSTTEA